MRENCMYEENPVTTLCKKSRFTCICEDPPGFVQMWRSFCTGLFLREAPSFWEREAILGMHACLLAMLCGDWICKIDSHLTFGSNLHFLVCVGSIKQMQRNKQKGSGERFGYIPPNQFLCLGKFPNFAYYSLTIGLCQFFMWPRQMSH